MQVVSFLASCRVCQKSKKDCSNTAIGPGLYQFSGNDWELELKECGKGKESDVAKRPCTIKIAQLLEEENPWKPEKGSKRYIVSVCPKFQPTYQPILSVRGLAFRSIRCVAPGLI